MAVGTASRLALVVVIAALANACQLQAVAPPLKDRPGKVTRPTDAPPQKATPTPAAPTPGPASAPAGLAKLRAPAGPSALLSGDVRLDAGYLVAAGAGNVISHNGALIVAAGGLNLIGADGASLVGFDGGSIVAAGAGNVISHNGGQVISHNGGQVLSHNGGQVISHNGGQALGGATGLRLLAAETPPAGALLAAAGVELRVYELASGKAVALGVDAAGQAVYGVLSDAAGHYALHLPVGLAGNVLVRARLPGQADPRLAYDLVSRPGAADGFATVVDEDTAIATRYLRRAFARKLEAVLDSASGDDAALVRALVAGSQASPALAALARQTLSDFRARALAAGVPKAGHHALAERATDVLIGRIAVEEITLDVVNTAWKGDADEPSLGAMRAILRRLREAAAAKLQADPAFFDAKTYVVKANALQPAGTPPLRVRKAADLGEILVDVFFAGLDAASLQYVTDAFIDLQIPYTEVDHLFAAASGIGLRLGTSFLADEEARAAVFAAIDQAGEQ